MQATGTKNPRYPLLRDDRGKDEVALTARFSPVRVRKPAAVEQRILDERADQAVRRLARELGRVADDARQGSLVRLRGATIAVVFPAAGGRDGKPILNGGFSLTLSLRPSRSVRALGRRSARTATAAVPRLGELLTDLDDEGRELTDVAAMADGLFGVAELGDEVGELRSGIGAVLPRDGKGGSGIRFRRPGNARLYEQTVFSPKRADSD